MNQRESELVLNEDGSVYHLGIQGKHIADHVLLVGDPARVETVASHFDKVTFSQQNREFHTCTGLVGQTPVTVISTGIGADNIDIVVTELDAAVNIDPDTRQPHEKMRSLNLIRLGTCGALQTALEVESTVCSAAAIGLDGVAHFYDLRPSPEEEALANAFIGHCDWPGHWNRPYVRLASHELLEAFNHIGPQALTITANGFFGPQGRSIRLPLYRPGINEVYRQFTHGGLRIGNYEMECSALYALGAALGHRCLTLCVVIANRYAGAFSKDYHPAVQRLVRETLLVLPRL